MVLFSIAEEVKGKRSPPKVKSNLLLLAKHKRWNMYAGRKNEEKDAKFNRFREVDDMMNVDDDE